MTPVTLKIEPWLRKVNQFKVLSMVTISENVKVIGEKQQEILCKQSLAQIDVDADADTHLGDGNPQ